MDLTSHRRRLDAALARLAHAAAKAREERGALTAAAQALEDAAAAQAFLQEASRQIQEHAHGQLAGVVTRCLATVFGSAAYEFKIIFEKRRNKTEARLVFLRDGQEVEPLEASGGGTVEIASFSLRLACLMLAKPQRRRLLVLDEPMRFVSREYRERVALMLEQLAEDLDMQFILVTHDTEFQVGTIIDLEKT